MEELEGNITMSSNQGGSARAKQMEPAFQSQPAPAEVSASAGFTEKFDLTKAAHPFACFFHMFFKVIAMLLYFAAEGIFGKTVLFVLVIVFNSFDFWTVKNVTGRYSNQLPPPS